MKISKIMTFAALLVSGTITSQNTRAELITFSFAGVVASDFHQYWGDGATFFGTYTFESATLDTDPSATFGYYNALVDMTVTIGGHTFTFDSSPTLSEIVVANDYAGSSGPEDEYVVYSSMQGSMGKYNADYIIIDLYDWDQPNFGAAFDSDELPLTPPNPSAFWFPEFQLYFIDSELSSPGITYTEIASGVIESISSESASPVPLPGSIVLLVSGLIGLVAIRKNKQR